MGAAANPPIRAFPAARTPRPTARRPRAASALIALETLPGLHLAYNRHSSKPRITHRRQCARAGRTPPPNRPPCLRRACCAEQTRRCHGRLRAYFHWRLVHLAAASGAWPGASNQGGVFLPAGWRVQRPCYLRVLAERRRHRPARCRILRYPADHGRADCLERRAYPVPCVVGRAGGAHRHRRRLARVRRMGGQAHQERPHGRLHDRRLGLGHVHRRLLQLPYRRRGHASHNRQVPHEPREAGMDHRLLRSAGVHHRAGFLVGGCRGRLPGR